MIDITKLRLGERVRIVGFTQTRGSYRQKLLSLGLVPGAEFILQRMAPLGDPIEILINNCSISLRKKETQLLLIEKV